MTINKPYLLLALLLSVGSAHGQSVVIDGGSIRVDATSTGKGTAVVKGSKSSAGKKSKVVVANDSDDRSGSFGTSAGGAVAVGTGASAINAGGRSSDAKGRKEYVNSDLSGQNLSRRNYAGASFTNVEAVGTNFSGADLSTAVLTNVDLSNADLRGANLAGAQMTNVDWDGALLDGATWVDGRRCGPGSAGKCK